MAKIQHIVPLFLIALFTAGVMAVGQAAAGNSSKSDCDNAKKDVNSSYASAISVEMEGRDN
jgi:hypothetical protein